MNDDLSAINQRLRAFLKDKRVSVNYLSSVLNVPQPTLHRQLGDSGLLGIDNLQAILRLYPELSADWVLLGKGVMLRTEQTSSDDSDMVKLLKDMLEDEKRRSNNYWNMIQQLMNNPSTDCRTASNDKA